MDVEVIGFLLRFLVPSAVPSIVENVATVEITTPITSFTSLQEAFYYLKHEMNLYDGGVNHHTPLMVVLLSFVNDLPFNHIWFNLLYAGADSWTVKRLAALNTWYSQRQKNSNKAFSDRLFKCFFLFNPLLILTNWSHNTLVFTNLLVIESIYQMAVMESQVRSMIILSLAAYINYTPVFLAIPLLAMGFAITKNNKDYRVGPKSRLFQSFGIFFASISLLFLCSFAMTSSTQFLDSCFLTIILFKKISPNLGLWWYFFTEMFEFFTPFFIGVYNLYSILFIIPFTIRFNEINLKPNGDAFFAIVLCYIWLIFTKSYPVVGDLGLALSIIPIFRPTILQHCKYGPFTALLLLGSLILSPILYYCWIVLGSGNSNFFYSINLVWGIVHGLILMDLIWAKLTLDYINDNAVSEKDQAELRLSQI